MSQIGFDAIALTNVNICARAEWSRHRFEFPNSIHLSIHVKYIDGSVVITELIESYNNNYYLYASSPLPFLPSIHPPILIRRSSLLHDRAIEIITGIIIERVDVDLWLYNRSPINWHDDEITSSLFQFDAIVSTTSNWDGFIVDSFSLYNP